MSPTLAIALNLVLDTSIVGALAYVMSRPARLLPHHAGAAVQSAPQPISPAVVLADLPLAA